MKALVTGGAGFIGSNLVATLLEQGHSVTVLDDLSTGDARNLPSHERMKFQLGDVRDARTVHGAMSGADVVFHLAAAVSVPRSLKEPIRDATINVLGTAHVLQAARQMGVKRVVLSSSAAVYGEPAQLPVTEECPTAPCSPYGASKLAAETLALAYGAHHGLGVVALRYFNVYGVNQRYDAYGNVIPIFANRMMADAPLTIYGDGKQMRDFVSVRDVVRANLLAVESGAGEAFNVASGKAITINELAVLVSQAFGCGVDVEYAPKRPGDARYCYALIEKAGRLLHYRPEVHLREGLAEYAEWVRCAS